MEHQETRYKFYQHKTVRPFEKNSFGDYQIIIIYSYNQKDPELTVNQASLQISLAILNVKKADRILKMA